MAKKKRKSRIQKFINYTREAFFWPAHLVMMAGITAIAALGILILPDFISPDLQSVLVPSIVMIAGGAELMLLSAISNNPRFIRAINAKYQKDIDAYHKTKTLVDYYNELSLESQQRFDKLRKRIKQVRDNFQNMSTSVPQLVNSFISKLNQIELSYARLLNYQDKIPVLANDTAIDKTIQEIDKINNELKTASARLKKIKEKRLRLLEMRMENYYKVKENKEIIEEQLHTIEEMVEYIKDQPITMQNTEREDIMIDNLLFETEQTQQSLEEIENLMQSEFYPGITDDFGSDVDSEYGEEESEKS